MLVISKCFQDDLDSKIDNLRSTDDGEPSEESHSSSNSGQHVHKFSRSVLDDSVKCCCIKVDPHKSQVQFRVKIFEFPSCIHNIQHFKVLIRFKGYVCDQWFICLRFRIAWNNQPGAMAKNDELNELSNELNKYLILLFAISWVLNSDGLATHDFFVCCAQKILFKTLKKHLFDFCSYTFSDNLRERGTHPHSCLKFFKWSLVLQLS